MTDPRERAVEALVQRRGLAGLFGQPEALRDVQAIEAAGIDLVARDAAPDYCASCDDLHAIAADPEARFFRGPDGGLIVIMGHAGPEEVAASTAGAVELVPIRPI